MSLAPGTRLGAYEIVALLGAGGMGEVYRARDTRLKREVAIKILPDAFAQDSERLSRFQREAELLATLSHPNIGAVFGMEQSGDSSAIILELIEGETLADRLKRGALPIEEAIETARQIAEAVEAAHEKGIIHRDLKPANIKLTPDGKVKVLDFGLAKAMETTTATQGLSHSPTLSMMATQAGVILGTAAYMSPEQAKGFAADRRSDVFAFGAVLYEMLTGRQPFHGDTAPDILASVIVREIDLTALPSNLNPRLVELLQRCLEKSPRKRWQAIGDVRAELERIATAPRSIPPIAAAVPHTRWRRTLLFAFTALATAAIGAVAMFVARPAPATPTVTRFSFTPGQDHSITNIGRQVVAISRDGLRIAYVADNKVWLRTMNEVTAKPIEGTESAGGVLNPEFSPDGQSIAFFVLAEQTLKKIAIRGGAPVTVGAAVTPYGINWSEKGIFVGQGSQGIIRLSADGGKPEQVVKPKAGEWADGPHLLPDGNTLMFSIASAFGGRWDSAKIVAQSLASGERKTLIEGGAHARYLPTGHVVYALGGVLYAVPFDVKRLQVTGGPTPVISGIRRGNITGTAHIALAENGTIVFVAGPSTPAAAQLVLVLFDESGRGETLKVPAGNYSQPRVSRDGQRISIDVDDGKDTYVAIYELSGTSSMRRLTFGGNNRYGVWSPDGQSVAFQSDREGDTAIFRQNIDGVSPARRMTRPRPGTAHVPESWSSDGLYLLFTSLEAGRSSLWVVSVADQKELQIDTQGAMSPRNGVFSPDGRWVAYQSGEGPVLQQVYVQPFPTGNKYQITKTGSQAVKPAWSPSGRELFYYLLGSNLVPKVSIVTKPVFSFKDQEPVQRRWSDLGVTTRRGFDVMPDGKRFLVVTTQGNAQQSSGPEQINVVLNWFEELKQQVPVKR
jgi:serine/threonine-protein kinase